MLPSESCQHLLLPALVLLPQPGVRAPNDLHPRPPARLDTRHAVFEDETLLGPDQVLLLRALAPQPPVDLLEREQVDVRRGLAAALADARVVAEHAALGREQREQAGQVRRLELVVAAVAARRQRDLDAAGGPAGEGVQQVDDAGERLGGGEQLALQRRLRGHVLVVGDGQLRPGVEDARGFGAGAALQLGFDGPGERGLVVAVEQLVGHDGVEVFGVEKEAVHVEEAGADRRGSGAWLVG